MRNLRKLTAAVLAIAIVLTSMTAVFAADPATTVVNGDKAVTLKALDLYAGTDVNDPAKDLDKALTTQDSLIFLAKLFGYNDAASKLTADEVAEALAKFDDADQISDYAKNVVAYSAINNILSGTTKGGKFFVGAKDTVTAARFATFMLKQMGYNVADYKASVAQLAANDGSKVSATIAGDLIRDTAVGVMYGTLTAKKADGATVIADIVGTDAAKKAIAEKAGLIAVAGLVKSVSAVTTTKVLVTLAKSVDSAAAANFAIAGASVSVASLSNGTDVVLTTNVLTPLKEYTLTVSGLKSGAVENASETKTFVVPDINKLYAPTLKAEKAVLKADGASSTLVTFTLADADKKTLEDAQDVEVAFSTTFGNFGEKRVSVQKGVATVMLTSEFLKSDKTADLTAVVVEAKDANLIGLKASFQVIMSPNPDAISSETLGASMVSAEANEADRVTVYFNKEVDVANYIWPTTADTHVKGEINTDKLAVDVRSDSTSAVTGNSIPVKGLLPVEGNKKAIQILLNTEASAFNCLRDNSNVFVSFTDKTGSVEVPRALSFKLTDARKPGMLSVENEGLKKIKITFSEAVNKLEVSNLANWSIDGILLSNAVWQGTSTATATVGVFDTTLGTDFRNVVTITLGDGKYFTTGAHSVQAANIGDYAKITDLMNTMNTQTLDFSIPVDNSQPSATVEVQSPEQWLVTYDRDLYESAAQFQSLLKLQEYNTSTSTWVDSTMPLYVTKIDANKFLVQTKTDWTLFYQTSTTLKNYFNFSFQLKIPKDTVTNVANGLKNSEQTLALAGAMLSPDTTSPVISDIVEVTAGTAYKAVMSEPVKMQVNAVAEGLTLAQTQASLPVVTAEFIKSDYSKTIAGTIGNAFLDSYDKVLDVKPVSTLEAGKWMLVIRSISDDIGNTAPSATKEFTVAGTVASNDFRVVWSYADIDNDKKVEAKDYNDLNTNGQYDALIDTTADNDTTADYVFIKFSKPVATSGDFKNALKTANYTLNGLALPTGTQILADIKGYDDLDSVTDSVTIVLPNDYLQGVNAPNIVNISPYLESTTVGEKLVNAGEQKLSTLTGFVLDQFNADIATRALVDDVKLAQVAVTTGGAINLAAVQGFEDAYDAAKASIDAQLVTTGLVTPAAISYVKAQYQSAIDSYKAAIVKATGFTANGVAPVVSAVNNGASADIAFSVLGSTVLPKASATATTGYTVSSSNPYIATVSGDTITVVTNGVVTITVTDIYWNVSKTLTVTIVGGVITNIA